MIQLLPQTRKESETNLHSIKHEGKRRAKVSERGNKSKRERNKKIVRKEKRKPDRGKERQSRREKETIVVTDNQGKDRKEARGSGKKREEAESEGHIEKAMGKEVVIRSSKNCGHYQLSSPQQQQSVMENELPPINGQYHNNLLSSFNGHHNNAQVLNNGHSSQYNGLQYNNSSSSKYQTAAVSCIGTWNKYTNNSPNNGFNGNNSHPAHSLGHHRSVSRLYNGRPNESVVSRSVSRSKRFLSRRIKKLTYTKRRRGGERGNRTLTKTRLKELLISNQGIVIHYPIKTVIALGISLTLLGVIMSIFTSLGYLIDSPLSSTHHSSGSIFGTGHGSTNGSGHTPTGSGSSGHGSDNTARAFRLTGSGTYIGITVSFSGILAIIAAKVPSSSFAIHCNLFFAILTIASTGFMTILTANSVFRDTSGERVVPTYADALVNSSNKVSSFQEQLRSDPLSDGEKSGNIPPGIFLDTFLLIISTLTSLVAFVNCCLTAREACQCYSSTLLLESKYIDGPGDGGGPIVSLGLNTLQRRERILKWIIQQSSTLESSTYDRSTLESIDQDEGTFQSFNQVNHDHGPYNNWNKRLSLPGPSGLSTPQPVTLKRPLSPPVYANGNLTSYPIANYDYRSKYSSQGPFADQGMFNNYNSLQRVGFQNFLTSNFSGTSGNFVGAPGNFQGASFQPDQSKSSSNGQMYQVLNISAISCPPGSGAILMSPSLSMSKLDHLGNDTMMGSKVNLKRSSVALNPNNAFEASLPRKYQSSASIHNSTNRISAYDY